MERRRLLAMLLVGIVLLAGATYRRVREVPRYLFVGVASTGDTVWLDETSHDGAYWSGLINGPTADGVIPGFEIHCAPRSATGSNRAAALELAAALADTACAHSR